MNIRRTKTAMPDDPNRLQEDAEPAGHAVPDARRSRAARAGLGEGMAGERRLRGDPRGVARAPALRAARRPAVRERRHPHRPRRQQDPEGHRRQEHARWRASTRRTCPAGIATACRSRCRSRRRTARTCRPRKRSGCAAHTRPSRSRGRRRTSSASACWATGTIRTRRWRSSNEADEIRTLGKLLEKGYLYRGLKPVNWCFDCRSALAEAEVEYEDRVDSPIDVGFPLDRRATREARACVRARALPDGAGLRGDLDDDAVDDSRQPGAQRASRISTTRWSRRRAGIWCSPQDLVDACLARYKLDGDVVATAQGRALERIEFRHPFYDRASPVYLGDYVTLEQGTGIVHSSPAYGIDDFQSCRRYGMTDDEILNPVQGDGRFAERACRSSAARRSGRRTRRSSTSCARSARCFHAEKFTHSYMHCWRHKTPIIYRATTQWFAGMDDVPGYRGAKPAADAARPPRCAASTRRSSFPRGARRGCTA